MPPTSATLAKKGRRKSGTCKPHPATDPNTHGQAPKLGPLAKCKIAVAGANPPIAALKACMAPRPQKNNHKQDACFGLGGDARRKPKATQKWHPKWANMLEPSKLIRICPGKAFDSPESSNSTLPSHWTSKMCCRDDRGPYKLWPVATSEDTHTERDTYQHSQVFEGWPIVSQPLARNNCRSTVGMQKVGAESQQMWFPGLLHSIQ